jgi:anti-sigma regulatory factor (Ser/Thr protein kinase)
MVREQKSDLITNPHIGDVMGEGILFVDDDPKVLSHIAIASLDRGYSGTVSVCLGELENENVLNVVTKLSLTNNPALIPLVAERLSSVVAAKANRRQSIELALDEALTNAMLHGNLEVSSLLKEENYSAFFDLAIKRQQEEPYASRRVEVDFSLSEKLATFTIADQGNGFDWRHCMESELDVEAVCGRGLLIMTTFASSVSFNETGNRVTLVFDREDRRRAPVAA